VFADPLAPELHFLQVATVHVLHSRIADQQLLQAMSIGFHIPTAIIFLRDKASEQRRSSLYLHRTRLETLSMVQHWPLVSGKR
jgi:hypothetical protein